MIKASLGKEVDEVVGKMISSLPRCERDVLTLRFYLNLSLQEMSVYLGLGLSATKMRLYRALELFEALMLKQQRVISTS